MKISTLDALKIQARAVGPIVRALEQRMGKLEAHRLVGDAIAESWAEHVASREPVRTHPRESGAEYPVERIIVTDTENEYRVNMTRCAFADYFRGIGEEEVGAMLSCGVDFAVMRRTLPEWNFSRTQTLMMGADHCDFCWVRNSPGPAT